ncbi:MAG: prolyl aminopeptidase [Acidobacteria bacterium]|nr:prolyl aminopeptidase [Acidobacteriota bacterium]
MRTLFDPIESYQEGMLQVSEIHKIYYEQSGNPTGKPVVFLHGGPGGGSDPMHRRFFDPNIYRIVVFDQRGSGRSEPFACLEENTTWDLVADIERLRQHLGIERWVVFGGSWGSTLSLAYAETHPERVVALVLRGIFLCRPEEIKWFYQEGAHAIYPDVWDDYLSVIPVEERGDMLSAYHRRLTSEDKEIQLAAARAWSIWEGSTSKLIPVQSVIDSFGDPSKAIPLARIECHYFMNNAFFSSNNYLIENIDKIRHIPGVIVQGRYDVVCPMMSAWLLHKAWPEAKLEVIATAGHSATEEGIIDALVRATDEFKTL